MNAIKKNQLKSRWIDNPPLKADELLRQSNVVKQGLVMGMQLAVLEEQTAAVVAEGRLVSVFLPGAYQLEKDKMPTLKPDKKYNWLYPAQLYFINMAKAPAEQWQPQEPLLTRDPERGLVQLTLIGDYEAQVEDVALFMQNMVLEQAIYDWPALHHYLNGRLNELAISLMAHNRTDINRLGKIKEKIALMLQHQMSWDLRDSGLALRNLRILTLEVHPQMRRLWQEQKDYLAFNRSLEHAILD